MSSLWCILKVNAWNKPMDYKLTEEKRNKLNNRVQVRFPTDANFFQPNWHSAKMLEFLRDYENIPCCKKLLYWDSNQTIQLICYVNFSYYLNIAIFDDSKSEYHYYFRRKIEVSNVRFNAFLSVISAECTLILACRFITTFCRLVWLIEFCMASYVRTGL